jgi:uncharacterized protein YegL
MILVNRRAGIGLGVRSTNYIQSSLIISCALVALAVTPVFAAEEGVALAIVYDTSGSMREVVKDKMGKPAAKYVIANHALSSITRQIQAFTTNSVTGEARRVDVGVFIFNSPGARAVVPFGKFDSLAIENWSRTFDAPSGGTPLGNALDAAAQAVLRSPLSRKHVLVITDGISNIGPTPAAVMPRLMQQAQRNHEQLSIHFIAFDVNGKVFEPVKKLGATVVEALDEKQLDAQLSFILQKKILLEEEEPAKK